MGGGRQGSETARRVVHLASGGCAFLLKHLETWQAAGLAAAALVFNLILLPRAGGAALFRSGERDRPWCSGIVLYPLAVLLLILLFHDLPEVAAASWGVMAAGDAAAGAAGRRFGRNPLPWNRAKTAEGSMAFALAAALFAWALLVWMGRRPLEAALLAAPTALFGMVVESLPWRLNDNLTVPLLSALFLAGLLQLEPGRLQETAPRLLDGFIFGVLVNLVLAVAFRRARVVDRSGVVAGYLIGVVTCTFAGWRGFGVLLSFFVLGSAATRLGYRRKERAGIAQPKHGARSARHALANCGVAVYLGIVGAGAGNPAAFVLAFICAYATAAFDTVSSEVGQAYGGRPVMITTLRRVPPGTNGAVSWLGTLAGAAAALLVGGVAVALGLLAPAHLGIVVAAAFVGSTADSLLGATLEARGLMGNEAVNFSNTLVGALTGVVLLAMTSAGGTW